MLLRAKIDFLKMDIPIFEVHLGKMLCILDKLN